MQPNSDESESKAGGKKAAHKTDFARLKKMHPDDLTKLHRAVSDELARRAKEHAKNKPMEKMNDQEFSDFTREQIAQAKG